MLDWRYIVRGKLMAYRAQKEAVRSMGERLKMLEAAADGIRAATADGAPARGGGNRREEALCANICEREEVKRALRLTMDEIALIDRGFDAISEEDMHLLTDAFIRGGYRWRERIAEERNISEAQVYREVNAALDRLTVAMYGRTMQ